MDLKTTAALIFLLCSQNTGALPVRRNVANYHQEASGNGKQGSFMKETAAAAEARNEDPPCQIVPDTDDPVSTTPPPPVSISKPGQKPPPPPPPPPPPSPSHVLYQPIMPHYVLHSPVRGGSYVYGQGTGQLLPHSSVGASGFLPAPQWFLDLLRDKLLSVRLQNNPTGNQRGPLQAQRFDSTSSDSSEESSRSD